MSFKKYVFSMVICAVTIFVMMFGAFVPIKSYADVDWSLLKAVKSDGGGFDWSGVTIMPHNVSFTWYESRRYHYQCIRCDKYEVTSITNDYIYLTLYNYTSQSYCFSTYYDEKPRENGSRTSGERYNLRMFNNANVYYYFSKFVKIDANSLLDIFLGDILGTKELFSDTIDEVSNSPVGKFFTNLGNNFRDYVKTTLGITDEDTLSNVITEISTDNYISDVWNNVPERTKKNIQQTYSNLKTFIYNNVDTTQDSDGKYHYIVKTYDTVTNTYPSYFYDDNYFYTNIVANDNSTTDDTNNWLQKIYNAIIDLPNKIKSNVTTNVTNTYNYLFTPSDDFWNEWDLKFSNTLNDKFPVIKQVEDFTKNVGDIINSYSEEDFSVGSINDFFAFDNDTEPEVQTLSLEDDISNVETSYTGYVPKISIDLSKIKLMGYQLGDGKVIVMDFTWYLKYRPLIFTLIIVISYTWYIISLGKSLPRLIGNVADVFDYRQDVEVANSINEYNESEYYFSELAKNSKE